MYNINSVLMCQRTKFNDAPGTERIFILQKILYKTRLKFIENRPELITFKSTRICTNERSYIYNILFSHENKEI